MIQIRECALCRATILCAIACPFNATLDRVEGFAAFEPDAIGLEWEAPIQVVFQEESAEGEQERPKE